MRYRLATESEAKKFIEIARDWFSKTDGKFSSYGSVAKNAVAEYVANCEGKTLYNRLSGEVK